MIGKLTGRLAQKAADHVLLDVGGVGYLVTVSDRTAAALPPVGEVAALWTDLLVREDLLQLFGFLSLEEKEWHRLLMGVQGIGAKASMAILGALGPEGVSRSIALGDWSAVAKAKGVGPKTAQRVVNELKDKAPTVMAMGGADLVPGEAVPTGATDVVEPVMVGPGSGTARSEALSALANLGYAPGDAAAAVAEALGETPDAETADLLRSALRRLAPKG